MQKRVFIVIILLLTLQSASAQAILQLDQLTSGELTEQTPTASYFIAVTGQQALHLQAVAVTPGLTLQATLNTAAGTLVQSIPNTDNTPSLEADLTPNADGIFHLDISSANGSVGKFVLLVQEITPPEPDATLTLNQPASSTLQPNASVVYALSGDPASRLIVNVTTTNPQDDLSVQLLGTNGELIASLQTQASGSALLIPARQADYQLKLDNTQENTISYEVTLQALDTPSGTPPPSETPVVTLAPTEDTTPRVTIAPSGGGSGNFRQGDSTLYGIITSLPYGTTAQILGISNRNTGWYQVQLDNGQVGWVAPSIVTTSGDLTNLPRIQPPPQPLRQWASSAGGSSEYGSVGWSFEQATGAPDTAECGDHSTAWASKSSVERAVLKLYFDQPVIPSQINIYESYHPGAIISVAVGNFDLDLGWSLPNSADNSGATGCPRVFSLNVSGIDTPVDVVTLNLDQSITQSWNEIDAVELVGTVPR